MSSNIRLFATVAAACAIGTAAALAGWHYYQGWAADRAKAQAAAEAIAFKSTPIGALREFVSQGMHDPGSAQFRNERLSKRSETIWCGEVNGRNRMGGMVGFQPFIVDAQLDHIEFAPALESDDPTSAAAVFRSRWKMFCE